ncbi:flagellar basal body P-ring formation protein FlgA [Aquicoccus porphyridii]|uniref:Flagella basal body P-ring formation protein FlgA n=1 Tax=Aquicoccus porphyridii TaxID=1852029 RepID=A0A5A9YXN9_9RHOB|nr:flagellar basal body P-ring formation chaperone FlgA [Aquicoccus porphyridii]KAA0909645.1 flagellar basal body P-ring formation protein FlgA [Aquicoccus porphyridii]RAI54467.1 flagella basal body P-ring formation protein FlgA [Rhodobacteraceae bacterium AsT-22]
MRSVIALLSALLATPVPADIVVPAHTIRPQSVIAPGDLTLRALPDVEGFDSVDDVIGLEARVALYPGRAIRPRDVGPPAMVERNQLVLLVFSRGGLEIRAEGRALDRAGRGEMIKVMNTASRNIVMGVVRPDGTVLVQ